MTETQPDFDAMGRESLWPAAEWRAAWGHLPDEEYRSALWPTVVTLGSGYMRPSSAAVVLVQAAVAERRSA